MRPRQSSKVRRPVAIRWQAYAVAALVLVAILFGGGGAEGPLNNGIIQALAAVVLALLFGSQVQGSWPLAKAGAGATWLLAAFLLIVVLQLVPLPPALWRSLPGRELAEASLTLIGAADDWRPLSLEPEATRRIAASLLLPAAILFGILGATRREILLIVRAALIAAAVSALIGALQIVVGNPAWLSFYDRPNPGAASGVFANQNHHAVFLITAMLLLAFLIRAERSTETNSAAGHFSARAFHPGWLALPFLPVLILSTGSRAGVILLLIAMPGALLIALGRGRPLLWVAGLIALASVTAATILLSPSGNASAIGQSLMLSEDSRSTFFPDVMYTLRQYWPWGSGLGTFVPVFAPSENLDFAGAGYVNHAHNDLLEWLIETGIVGAIWLAVAAAVVVWRLAGTVLNAQKLRGSQFAAVLTGTLILLVVALHSLIDYPLRMAAVAAVAALAAGLMFSPLADAPPRPVGRREGTRWVLVPSALAGLILGALVLRIFAAEAAARERNGLVATSLRPESGRALALAADAQLKMRNLPAARRLAAAAIARAPLNSVAVRVLAMTLQPAAAVEPWRIASAMGWRDGPTQLWAFRQALINGELEVAAVRADAFLRTRGRTPEEFLALVRAAAVDPQFRRALIERLKLDPRWRRSFFMLLPETKGSELDGAYAVLTQLAETSAKPTRLEARGTINALLRQKQYQRAIALYRSIVGPPPSDRLVGDLNFARSTAEYLNDSTPFDWTLSRSAAAVEEVDGERRLIVETNGLAAHQPVRRLLPLKPGRYQLTFRIRGDADAAEAFAFSVRCVEDRLPITPTSRVLAGSPREQRGIMFSVPENCPLIKLALEARAVGYPAEAEFSDLSLRRI